MCGGVCQQIGSEWIFVLLTSVLVTNYGILILLFYLFSTVYFCFYSVYYSVLLCSL